MQAQNDARFAQRYLTHQLLEPIPFCRLRCRFSEIAIDHVNSLLWPTLGKRPVALLTSTLLQPAAELRAVLPAQFA